MTKPTRYKKAPHASSQTQPVMLHPESFAAIQEREYRRGYHDGFLAAVRTLGHLVWKVHIPFKDAHTIALGFGEATGRLFHWLMQGDMTEQEEPPTLDKWHLNPYQEEESTS